MWVSGLCNLLHDFGVTFFLGKKTHHRQEGLVLHVGEAFEVAPEERTTRRGHPKWWWFGKGSVPQNGRKN